MVKAGSYAVAAKVGRAFGRWTGRRLFKGGRSGSSYGKKRRGSSRRSVKRRKVAKGHVTVDGAGGSHSLYKRVHMRYTPRIRGIQSLLSKSLYSTNDVVRVTAGASFQAVNDVGALMGGTQLDTISRRIVSNATSGYATNKFIVHTAYMEQKITNMDKGNVQITLYDVVPKRDISDSNYYMIAAFTNGLADMNDVGGTTHNISNLGATPFDSPRFCQYFTVKNVTKVTLGQGQCHIHRTRVNVNRVFTEELFQSLVYLRGITTSTMLIANGLPLNDQTTKTNISTGAVVLDVVKQYRIVYQGIVTNVSQYGFTDAQVPPSTAYLMDYGSGEPEADAAA